jgi:hypothetical protein
MIFITYSHSYYLNESFETCVTLHRGSLQFTLLHSIQTLLISWKYFRQNHNFIANAFTTYKTCDLFLLNVNNSIFCDSKNAKKSDFKVNFTGAF